METNFWTYLINAALAVAAWVIDQLPHHQDIGMDAIMASLMTSAIVVVFILLGQFINLWLVFTVFAIMSFMEGVRSTIAIIKWIVDILKTLALFGA